MLRAQLLNKLCVCVPSWIWGLIPYIFVISCFVFSTGQNTLPRLSLIAELRQLAERDDVHGQMSVRCVWPGVCLHVFVSARVRVCVCACLMVPWARSRASAVKSGACSMSAVSTISMSFSLRRSWGRRPSYCCVTTHGKGSVSGKRGGLWVHKRMDEKGCIGINLVLMGD